MSMNLMITSSVVTGNHWVGYDSDISTKVSPGDRDKPQFKQRELPQNKVAVVHTKSACLVREEVACPEIMHQYPQSSGVLLLHALQQLKLDLRS